MTHHQPPEALFAEWRAGVGVRQERERSDKAAWARQAGGVVRRRSGRHLAADDGIQVVGPGGRNRQHGSADRDRRDVAAEFRWACYPAAGPQRCPRRAGRCGRRRRPGAGRGQGANAAVGPARRRRFRCTPVPQVDRRARAAGLPGGTGHPPREPPPVTSWSSSPGRTGASRRPAGWPAAPPPSRATPRTPAAGSAWPPIRGSGRAPIA